MTTKVTIKVSGDNRATVTTKSGTGADKSTVTVDGDRNDGEHSFNVTGETSITISETTLTDAMKSARPAAEDRSGAYDQGRAE